MGVDVLVGLAGASAGFCWLFLAGASAGSCLRDESLMIVFSVEQKIFIKCLRIEW